MIKRTKIVATLGPATDDTRTLEKLLNAGLDVARLNYSHGNQDEQSKRIQDIRRQARRLGKEITVIADLQGPKIRICQFKDSSVTLKENAHFVIDTKLGVRKGTAASVGVTYKNLAAEVASKDILVLDDGRIVLKVLKVSGSQIVTKVLTGGILSNNKGINKLGGGLSAASLTSKDKKDLKHAVLNEVDYVAISFPRCADDILYAKKLIKKEIYELPKYEDKINYPFFLRWLKIFRFGKVIYKAAILLWCYDNIINISKNKPFDTKGEKIKLINIIIKMYIYEWKKASSLREIKSRGLVYRQNF